MRSAMILLSGAAMTALGARTVSTCVRTAEAEASLLSPAPAPPTPDDKNGAPLYLKAFEHSSLELAARAALLPQCRFALRYDLGRDMPLPHLLGLLELSNAAPEPRLAALLPRALEQEPILASQSVRWTLIERACRSIADPSLHLSASRWAELAQLLEPGNLSEMFVSAMEHERALAWADGRDLDRLNLMCRAVRLSGLPYRRAAADETRLERELSAVPEAPALRRCHARLTAAIARLALTRHYCLLKAGIQARIPDDPFTGARSIQRGIWIYSVGPNLVDDNGQADDILVLTP